MSRFSGGMAGQLGLRFNGIHELLDKAVRCCNSTSAEVGNGKIVPAPILMGSRRS